MRRVETGQLPIARSTDQYASNSLNPLILGTLRKQRIGTEFHGFMHLPIELRNLIYKHLLIQVTVFVPRVGLNYDVSYDSRRTMDWVERRYSRYADIPHDWGKLYEAGKRIGLISGASQTVFYGRNRFVFPYGDFSFTEDNIWGPLPEYRQIHTLLRDVSISFDMRDCRRKDYCPMTNRYRYGVVAQEDAEDSQGNVPAAPTVARQTYLELVHNGIKWTTEEAFMGQIYVLHKMELNRLQLDLEECYYAMGCCWMVKDVLDEFINVVWEGQLSVLEIMGWKNDAEKQMIEKKVQGMRWGGIRASIVFVGISTTEARAARKLAYAAQN
ncbi:Uu.00g129670.m01.CDS01 [Anthostomella pinea]|uniref:Uu.00g129670.m01.CDS01 n=1 Tax=Anthostomella pinea TaxID=933095 RepID=A0AAI8VIG9_9PEZI|nr:Uu.00g129670.m01.CDS01 [Anthostomella pinea]